MTIIITDAKSNNYKHFVQTTIVFLIFDKGKQKKKKKIKDFVFMPS